MTDDEADWISIAAGYLPEGYVIVPVEPTESMINAGWLECEDPRAIVMDVYKAMIQAAQEEE
jgi:hypothetical protein